jgi:hypothetical protein
MAECVDGNLFSKVLKRWIGKHSSTVNKTHIVNLHPYIPWKLAYYISIGKNKRTKERMIRAGEPFMKVFKVDIPPSNILSNLLDASAGLR